MNNTTIREEDKIPLISLAHAIESGEITMNKAYKTAVGKMGFNGSIGDFVDLLKDKGLIKKEEDLAASKEAKRKKIFKYAGWGVGITVGVIVLNKVLTNKS